MPMNTSRLFDYRFIARRNSRVYATLAAILPILFVWRHHTPRLETALASSIGIIVCASLLPAYAAWIIRVENSINLRIGRVTPSRLARFALNVPLVFAVSILVSSATVSPMPNFQTFLLTVAASTGMHALATRLAYRGHGERTSNLILAFAMSLWLVAASCVAETAAPYLAAPCAMIFVADWIVGALADIRSYWYPRRGIGVFFGSFNPVHNTHLRIIRDALERRRLEKVYIHCTTVPKLHRQALAAGEIEMSREGGMRVYKTTTLADPVKNYFPTGNRFYDYELRHELLTVSLIDAGLAQRAEVLDQPDIYERDGFIGVLREIKRQHPDKPIHGLHGSDTGGMWVRQLFEDGGWIYPYAVVRSDQVSATAIRNGATGLTSKTVEQFLAAARAEGDFVFASGYRFKHARAHDKIRSESDVTATYSTTLE
jgi:hypothetical protein